MASPRPKDAAAGQEGFTLVEMVIALALIAVIFTAVAGVLNSGLRAMAIAKSRAQANDIATRGIEDLQRFGFNNLGVCGTYVSTPPSGLGETVTLPNCPTPAPPPPAVAACDAFVFGNTPTKEYTCTTNNVTYEVRRYVAWVDALRTTKRLAVFVDWTDLSGRHQVSQQSSLRAPDQGAILGLAPPTFSTSTPPRAIPSSDPIELDASNFISSGSVSLNATVTNMFGPATATLGTTIPTHNPGDRFEITLTPGTSKFPNYNGYKVTVTSGSGSEVFTVLRGATTSAWLVVAEGTLTHSVGTSTIRFDGDKVHASLGTLDAAGNPDTATLFLTPVGPNGVTGQPNWSTTLDAADGLRFGAGSQYFSFGILRSADGKSSAAFATPDVEFCVNTGTGCVASAANPSIDNVFAPGTVDIDEAGALLADVTVRAETENVTDADTVTVSFVTQAGVVSVLLQPDPSPVCPTPATATPGVQCRWTGTISRTAGYRFAAEEQRFYFGARQVNQAGTIDTGSTAAKQSSSVVVFS